MEIFTKYPELAEYFDGLYRTRRDEILCRILEDDPEYKKLCGERAYASMRLKESVIGTASDELLESYSDAIFAQETYELEALYKQAVCDVLNALNEKGLIKGTARPEEL